MRLIVGLGNHGKEFEGTRHNVGFQALDRLAERLGISFAKKEDLKALVARSSEKDCLLIKPLTYMNLSGQSVMGAATFFKVEPVDIWVIYDDADLPVGTARARQKGRGQTKHKGLVSIAAALGTPEFPRFRVGIAQVKETGRAGEHPIIPVDLKEFVLQPFDRRELPLVEKAITWVEEEILAALKRGRVISRTLTKGV